MNNSAAVPAPASAQARATKVDRVAYLEEWAKEHPLETIESAREAVRKVFKISLGTKIISDTLRQARQHWEDQRKAGHMSPVPMIAPTIAPIAPQNAPMPPVLLQINTWAEAMKAAGIRLIEILPDGGVRVDFASTPGPTAS